MFWKTIATGFGSGYSPIAPGTAGALLALLIAMALGQENPWEILSLLTVLFFFLGVKATNELEPEWGHDPSKIVVDEMVGLWLSLLFVPFSWTNYLLAFALFRCFDIFKPLGIRQMEKLPGGWGVMMDDVLAGVYSLTLMHLYLFLI